MLKHRLIFGTVMVIALVGLILADQRLGEVSVAARTLPQGLALSLFFCVVIPLGCRELVSIFRHRDARLRQLNEGENGDAPAWWLVTVATLGVCALSYLRGWLPSSDAAYSLLMAIFVTTTVLAMALHSVPQKRVDGALAVGGAAMFITVYVGVLPAFFIQLRVASSAYVIAGVILITKSCDIGAYFTGRAMGKRKLIPWLSPGKTIEGLMGGLTLAALVAVGLTALSNHFELAGVLPPVDGVNGEAGQPRTFALWAAALAGVAFGLVGHVGDLLASLLKRDAGIKDSGNTIPGFGGVLDVVDSPLLVAPLAYALLA